MKKYLKTYFEPGFLISVIVLIISTAGMKFTINKLNIVLQKDPIPLINSFSLIDESLLTPYKVIKKSKVENPEVLESLGTEEYIQWIIEDTSVDENSPVRFCSLFLTYYTGINDRIPHVPEECYFGAGSSREDLIDTKVSIKSNTENPELKVTIPVRQLVFSKKSAKLWEPAQKFSVLYFFKVNGKYAGNRTAARAVLAENIAGKYSYFSKVEWRFFGSKINPNKNQCHKASQKLLETIVPILEKNHWPDIEKAEKEAEEAN